MNKDTPGALLRRARIKCNLTQAELGTKVGLSQSRISRLETGRGNPTEQEWTRLRECLHLRPGVSPSLTRPIPSKIWHARKPQLGDRNERPPSVRMHAAKKSFGPIVEQRLRQLLAREDAELCQAFLREAAPESGHEYFLWLTLLAAGGRPCWFSPFRAGFRALGVVESKTKLGISDLRLPCLELQATDTTWLLYPQVTLDARKSYYRLDALASVLISGKRSWLNLEVDGQGHHGEWDALREQHLDILTLRLSPADLAVGNLVALLEAKVLGLSVLPLAS